MDSGGVLGSTHAPDMRVGEPSLQCISFVVPPFDFRFVLWFKKQGMWKHSSQMHDRVSFVVLNKFLLCSFSRC